MATDAPCGYSRDGWKRPVARMSRLGKSELDLRGNGGGNSLFGRLIADELVGEAHAQATLGGGTSTDSCSKVWRTSDRNLTQLHYYRDVMGPRQGPEAVKFFTREHAVAAAAKAVGQPFSGPVRCPSSVAPTKAHAAGPTPASPKPRLVLLTDNSCFSSCLIVVDEFRRLGALHVGQTTDANTHYMEVREETLPSGLSVFSTLQALHPGSPAQMGPFVPHVIYDGAIIETAALEEWVSQRVFSREERGCRVSALEFGDELRNTPAAESQQRTPCERNAT